MAQPVRAVFLDRDGVINVNRPGHVKRWEEFEFLHGALQALAELASAALPVIVVTNQAAINRGLVTREEVNRINLRMKAEIERHGGRLDAVLYCPHTPEENCGCRKPMPGLLAQAAWQHGLDLRQSFLVGDALTDVDAGAAVGCKTILVQTGLGEMQHKLAVALGRAGYVLVRDLREAVTLILREHEAKAGQLVSQVLEVGK